MPCFGSTPDPYAQSLIAFFLLITPVAFYILGLYEDRRGSWLFGAGLLVHAASIIQRFCYSGLPPLSQKHDNISFMAFVMALIYFRLRLRHKAGKLSPYALPMIAAFIFIALGHRPLEGISPFMNTPWFYLHIVGYFSAYAFFGIAAAAGAAFIVTRDTAQEAMSYRLALVGWIVLTASLLAGSIWFYLAYGTYWLWTSREMWITITWLFYGLYLHARLIRRLRGVTATALGMAAFALALFTYFGVGTIIKSPPTQF